MNAESRFWPAVPDNIWDRIRSEFTLPELSEVKLRFEAMSGEPEALMRQLVRVFVGEGTYCPGFQFREDGFPDPAVRALLARALEMGVPHNVFAAWMITPLRSLGGSRPVDALDQASQLVSELASFADRYRPGTG